MKKLGQVRNGLESMSDATLVPSYEILGVTRGFQMEIGQLVVAGEPNPRRLGVVSSIAIDLNTPFCAVTTLNEAEAANNNAAMLEGHRLILVGEDTPRGEINRLVSALNHLPNLVSIVQFHVD